MDFAIRLAEKEDLPALVALELDAFSGDTMIYGYPIFDYYLTLPEAHFLVAVLDEKIIGYAILNCGAHVYDGKNLVPENGTNIDSLAVHSSLQGQGYAQKLMDEAENWARADGKEVLMLQVRETNSRARRFYEKEGYGFLSTLPHLYSDGGNGLLLSKALEPLTPAQIVKQNISLVTGVRSLNVK